MTSLFRYCNKCSKREDLCECTAGSESALSDIVMFDNSVSAINKARNNIEFWFDLSSLQKAEAILAWGASQKMQTKLTAGQIAAAVGKFNYLRQDVSDFLDFICAYDAATKI